MQYTWFRVITRSTLQEGGMSFKHTDYEACYYPGPLLWEEGKSPHAIFAPEKVALFDFALLRDWSNIDTFAVDKLVTNYSNKRWIGDISMPWFLVTLCLQMK